MAWTTPKTFSAAAVLTAAELNTHLRDNLNETCAATVTTAGDIVYADAANSMGTRLAIGNAGGLLVSTGTAPVWRVPDNDQQNSANFTFTNSSYLALDSVTGGTPGTAVTVTVTTGTQALVLWRAKLANDTAGALVIMSYAISGATTSASSDVTAMIYEANGANDTWAGAQFDFATGLTAGSNTFELEARTTAGTATVQRTELVVIPL